MIDLCLALTLAITWLLGSAPQTSQFEWTVWKQRYGKAYQQNEEVFRRQVYFINKERINIHNSIKKSYTMKINQFADLEVEEFKKLRLREKNPKDRFARLGSNSLDSFSLQDIDWRAQGHVTAVKNQGNCYADWAFAATGAVESYNKKKTGTLTSLSEQHLIDCDNDFNSGCEYGLGIFAYDFILQKGITTQRQYPYKNGKEPCKLVNSFVKISDVQYSASCQDLSHDLLKNTIAVVVDATNFQFYQEGVFQDCDPDSLNHQMLLVGMKSSSYWILKNSWGSDWGEAGYIRVGWQHGCGVCQLPSYPV